MNKKNKTKTKLTPFDRNKHVTFTENEKEKIHKLEFYDKFEWTIEVCKIETGGSFGELALITNNPRAASVICVKDCYFATLGKSDYKRVL